MMIENISWIDNKKINKKKYLNKNITKTLIHIGFHKTATSSIQQSLHANNRNLIDNDIYYSENTNAANAFTLFGLFCFDPVNRYDYHYQRGNTKKQVDKFNKSNLHKLLLEIKNCPTSNILFSEEHLSGLIDENIIKKLRIFLLSLMPNTKIEIVCCIRNPVDFFTSSFQQYVVGNNYLLQNEIDVSNYPIEKYVKYKLDGYLNAFGKENVNLYTFENACKNERGPVGYFFENILKYTENEVSKIKIIKTNEGRSVKMLELVSYCNSRIPYYTNGKRSKDRLFRDTGPMRIIRGEKLVLPVEEQKKIFNAAFPEIMWLKDNFNIDYSNYDFKDTNSQIVYDNDYYDDILRIIPNLSETLKKLVYDFVCLKLETVTDCESIKWLGRLKNKLNFI